MKHSLLLCLLILGTFLQSFGQNVWDDFNEAQLGAFKAEMRLSLLESDSLLERQSIMSFDDLEHDLIMFNAYILDQDKFHIDFDTLVSMPGALIAWVLYADVYRRKDIRATKFAATYGLTDGGKLIRDCFPDIVGNYPLKSDYVAKKGMSEFERKRQEVTSETTFEMALEEHLEKKETLLTFFKFYSQGWTQKPIYIANETIHLTRVGDYDFDKECFNYALSLQRHSIHSRDSMILPRVNLVYNPRSAPPAQYSQSISPKEAEAFMVQYTNQYGRMQFTIENSETAYAKEAFCLTLIRPSRILDGNGRLYIEMEYLTPNFWNHASPEQQSTWEEGCDAFYKKKLDNLFQSLE